MGWTQHLGGSPPFPRVSSGPSLRAPSCAARLLPARFLQSQLSLRLSLQSTRLLLVRRQVSSIPAVIEAAATVNSSPINQVSSPQPSSTSAPVNSSIYKNRARNDSGLKPKRMAVIRLMRANHPTPATHPSLKGLSRPPKRAAGVRPSKNKINISSRIRGALDKVRRDITIETAKFISLQTLIDDDVEAKISEQDETLERFFEQLSIACQAKEKQSTVLTEKDKESSTVRETQVISTF